MSDNEKRKWEKRINIITGICCLLALVSCVKDIENIHSSHTSNQELAYTILFYFFIVFPVIFGISVWAILKINSYIDKKNKRTNKET